MSFFNIELENLRSKNDFDGFINSAKNYQDSEEFQNSMNDKKSRLQKESRRHICKIVNNHFNSSNKDFETSQKNLTFFVGNLSEGDKNDLKKIFQTKGYTVKMSEDGKRMTVLA